MPDFVDTLPTPATPPRTNARHLENRRLAAELRENPGLWTRYPHPVDSPSDLRYRIANGRDAAFGPGFDAAVRGTDVYIAYTGE